MISEARHFGDQQHDDATDQGHKGYIWKVMMSFSAGWTSRGLFPVSGFHRSVHRWFNLVPRCLFRWIQKSFGLTELLFLHTNTWFCAHIAHEYVDLCTTKNSRKLDDSAELVQIVPTIPNQISTLYSISQSSKMGLFTCNWIFQSSKI
jgi:hypothetical protein